MPAGLKIRIEIGPVEDTKANRRQLCDLLVETVASGGSVSFMHPLSMEDAQAFWEKSLA